MPITLKDLGLDQQQGVGRKNLLHGKDVPKDTASFPITISRVRKAPADWNAALIFDLKKPVFEKNAWVVNAKNAKLLAKTVKGGDFELLQGKTITLWVYDTETPEGDSAIGLLCVDPEELGL